MDESTSPTTGTPARKAVSTLMTVLPLEIRHQIFEWASERPKGPKKVLRKWFEKKEVAEETARRIAEGVDDEDDDEEDGQDEDEEDEDGEEDEDDGEEDDGEEEEEEEDNGEEDDDAEMADADGEEDGDGNGDTTAAATTTQTQAIVVQPSRKWRHIPGIMQLTHCPPPMNLLLACKDLHQEALNWYYDVAVLNINATAGFKHATFFEDSLRTIVECPYSPMQHIRRVTVTMTYDTSWLKSQPDLFASQVFEAILRTRIEHVVNVLLNAPNLKKLVLKWNDSSSCAEAVCVKTEMLDMFNCLFAEIEVQEDILEEGVDADADSVHGLQRMEFEDFADDGCQFY